ncbi:hypothetical protein GCM10023226_38360 [Nocardioides nanhaiensis]|uniref:Uncharacterized protein n=1 Tax=Nocardioides nanhaiensis TaxID=1476871 RepID=A0ABP8WVX3_9ACTN
MWCRASHGGASARAATGATSLGGRMTQQPSEEEIREIEEERERRLDPANRPENAEVDNTQRDFDPEEGEFKN